MPGDPQAEWALRSTELPHLSVLGDTPWLHTGQTFEDWKGKRPESCVGDSVH